MRSKVQNREAASRRGVPRGTRRQPEISRGRILQAALAEFGQRGFEGGRMDAIAAAAGVNKALLYYYFRSKDELYKAVLDDFFQRLHANVNAALDTSASAGERILLYARAHFDSIADSPYHARLVQGEMLSPGHDASSHLSKIVDEHIAPIALRIGAVLEKGIKRREFRTIDPVQFAPTLAASIVFYFIAAPVVGKIQQGDPFSAEALAQRRAAVLDFIAGSLFSDREAGLKLAKEITDRPTEHSQQDTSSAAPLSAKRGS